MEHTTRQDGTSQSLFARDWCIIDANAIEVTEDTGRPLLWTNIVKHELYSYIKQACRSGRVATSSVDVVTFNLYQATHQFSTKEDIEFFQDLPKVVYRDAAEAICQNYNRIMKKGPQVDTNDELHDFMTQQSMPISLNMTYQVMCTDYDEGHPEIDSHELTLQFVGRDYNYRLFSALPLKPGPITLSPMGSSVGMIGSLRLDGYVPDTINWFGFTPK